MGLTAPTHERGVMHEADSSKRSFPTATGVTEGPSTRVPVPYRTHAYDATTGTSTTGRHCVRAHAIRITYNIQAYINTYILPA